MAKKKLGEILLARSAVRPIDLDRALSAQTEHPDRLGQILSQLGVVSREDVLGALGEQFGLPTIEPAEFPESALAQDHCSERFLKTNRVLPLYEEEDEIHFAIPDPTQTFIGPALELAFDKTIVLHLAEEGELEEALARIYPDEAAGSEGADEFHDNGFGTAAEVDVALLRDMASDAPVIQAVNRLVTQALALGASDLHIEPSEGRLVVRMRRDGIMVELETMPLDRAPAILSRIKIMSNLDIAERRHAQDGRFRFGGEGGEIDVRVSIIPTLRGEGAVLRLLRPGGMALDLAALGMSPEVRKGFEAALEARQGMVLVTGPTGSGKTTSLYAAMQCLDAGEHKIVSVEDPVEYRIEGVTQIQVDPKIDMGFANALRSILRHDPDILMIGEMRDTETARIAVQSALTGHLVLSTIHTNNAASAVTRLLDMGVEPYLITSTVLGALGQRLVRKICPACVVDVAIEKEVFARYDLHAHGFEPDMTLPHGQGCEACFNTGYSGRTGIYEYLAIDEQIRHQILDHTDAHEIEARAIASGMKTMWCDGLEKVRQGQTTLDELLRVTGGDDHAGV